MKSEYNSFIENDTQEIVSSSTKANIINGQQIFRLKKDRFGNVLKYKACWVIHRYKQKESLDYVNIFTAIIKRMSYKYLIAMGIRRKFCIRYMDIVTTFFYSFLNKVIYIEQPHLFKININKVYKLLKAIYTLKQAFYV